MIALTHNILYFSPIKILCLDESCLATLNYKNKIVPITWDYGHLTEAGSAVLARKLFVNYINISE
jgi:hypothetical protein